MHKNLSHDWFNPLQNILKSIDQRRESFSMEFALLYSEHKPHLMFPIGHIMKTIENHFFIMLYVTSSA